MKHTRNPHAEAQLAELATQFDHWRKARTSRAERIPLALWDQAVALTSRLSLAQVAKTLRVSWRDLHQHCLAHAASGMAPPSPTALHFVEVPPAAMWSRSPRETTIELQRPDGVRLRIVTHEAAVPFATLVRTFLEPPACSN
jgi:hypothetical protein